MNSGQKRLDDIVGAPAEAAQTDDRLAGEETIQGLFGNPRKVTGVAVGLAAQDYTGVFIGGHEQPHSAVCRRSGRGGVLGWTRCAIEEMRQLRRRADDLPIALGRIVAAGGSGWLWITRGANVHPRPPGAKARIQGTVKEAGGIDQPGRARGDANHRRRQSV